jgi:hypothetical protein
MKTVLTAAALGLALPGLAAAQCYSVAPDGQQATELDGYVLTDATAQPGLMDAPPLAEDAAGIMCDRDTIVPDANDFEVLYHAPLYIRSGQGEATTILALGYSEGQYVVQLPQGSINDEERAAIVAALEGFNEGEAALQAYRAEQEAAAEDG